MKSIYYITILMRSISGAVVLGASAVLAGCAEVPIAKTNCWTPPTVTASTRGMAPGAVPAVLPEAPVSDVQPCK